MADVTISTAEIRRVAAEVTHAAIEGLATSDEVRRLIEQFSTQMRQENAAHREEVRRQIDSLDKHVRALEDHTGKKIDQLAAHFGTMAARIEGALSSYETLERARLAEVASIRDRAVILEERVNTYQDELSETRGLTQRLERELHGDQSNPGVPSVYGMIKQQTDLLGEIRKQLEDQGDWIASRRRIENLMLNCLGGTLRNPVFWRWAALIVGSGGAIAVLVELVKALGGG